MMTWPRDEQGRFLFGKLHAPVAEASAADALVVEVMLLLQEKHSESVWDQALAIVKLITGEDVS